MADSETRYVEFTVRGLAIDPRANLPILLLQDTGERVVLPIWIGANEAGAIAVELEGQELPRPMTHDLLKLVIEQLDASVDRVDIRALDGGTFFADLVLRRNDDDEEIVVDCRPSDAIALAVRTGARIRVAVPVLDAAQTLSGDPDSTEDDEPAPDAPVALADDPDARAKLEEWLSETDPDDVSKYKM